MNPITPEQGKTQEKRNMTTMDRRNIEATILNAMEKGEKGWLKILVDLHKEGEIDFIWNTLNKHWDKQKQRDAYREKIGTR